MKINDYNATLDEKMSEFDMWVTPSLGEIRDTPQFRINLEQLKGFDYIADITENFADVSHCSSSALAANVLGYLSGKEDEIYQLLRDEGYTDKEINRAFSASVSEKNIVAYDEHKYAISSDRVEIVRKYCLLDIIANYGAPISVGNESGCLLVAGFETSWGLPQNEAIRIAQEVFPGLGKLWHNVQDAFDDIQWLISKGIVITK